MCIYARAGVHQNSIRAWALDANEMRGCRGLAGLVWFLGVTRSCTAACDWPADGNQAQKAEYADSLGMTVAEAETLNVKSRTLIATPIEVNGAKWGVLVLDCCKAITIPESDTSTQHRLLSLAATVISGILREAER